MLIKTTLVLFLFLLQTLQSQTEDFEDEAIGSTTFTLNSEIYITSGDFLINEFGNFSCNGSTALNKYLDTGYLDGISSGIFGTISKQNNTSFRVSTSIAQCGFSGRNDGDFESDGVLRVTGIKADNSTISEEFNLSPPNFNTLVPFTFSSTIWQGEELITLQFEIVSGDFDYFAIDNLVFDDSTLNIQQYEEGLNVSVSPNPSKDLIYISGLKNNSKNYELINTQGQILMSGKIANSESTISLKSLNPGMYFIRFLNKTLRVIKK